MATDIVFNNNTAQHRYEATVDGRLAGFAEYNLLTDAIMFTHTEVLPENEGKGIGSAIARHVLDDARAQKRHVIPVCQFIAGYIRKHPDYVDLVRDDIRRAFKI
ncbi:GNAT family N-acetyltransferase [Variovorax sp. PAMC 28711]|uniref:GNAT family N-acetyltransferase n=1 Tax=Variovorax sp. PAMC 28711 TaxID=1795631 RepID=UPI00078D2906|nr:acetyltransferase [Variovorax sp. PAMC 28711]